MRQNGRAPNALRPVFLGPGFARFAQGSCFVKVGDTHVLCTATVEERVPPFLRHTGSGWITAEYGMLPCSSTQRVEREATRGKQTGRTQEIQRLIGRSLRSVVDLKKLGERQIIIDCDVLQADGGTRTASITGGYVALHQTLQNLVERRILPTLPLKGQVAAISCGLIKNQCLLDLNYEEDSAADVDANFVMTEKECVEIQASGEEATFSEKNFFALFQQARQGINELLAYQKKVLKI